MTELKDNCSLLSTINTILASKLSVEIPCDFRKVKDSKVLTNSSLQTYLTFIHSKQGTPNLCNIRQFIHKKISWIKTKGVLRVLVRKKWNSVGCFVISIQIMCINFDWCWLVLCLQFSKNNCLPLSFSK